MINIENNYVIVNNKYYDIGNIYSNINNSEILKYINFKQLIEIFNKTFGIPYNVKDYLYKIIELYDKSENINSFLCNNKTYWFSKEVRMGLLNVANNSEEKVELALGDDIVEIDGEKLKKFLADLEVYAQKCFVNTKKHINAIKEIRELEDLINYDYTKGYPEKLELNVDTTV